MHGSNFLHSLPLLTRTYKVAHANIACAPMGLFRNRGASGGFVWGPDRALVLALGWCDFADGSAIRRGSRF